MDSIRVEGDTWKMMDMLQSAHPKGVGVEDPSAIAVRMMVTTSLGTAESLELSAELIRCFVMVLWGEGEISVEVHPVIMALVMMRNQIQNLMEQDIDT
jgi:hypothetical protein